MRQGGTVPVALERIKLFEEQESPAAAEEEAKTGLLESVPHSAIQQHGLP